MGDVGIEPWSEDDLELLRQLNQPSVRAYTGGTETDDQVIVRHGRYLRGPVRGAGQMFAVVLLPERVKVGSVGYWPRVWHDEPVYEMGWAVLPEFQGRGIATAAVRAVVDAARARGDRRWAHAYPSVDNPPSNAVCRKAGFELVGPTDFEYPPGQWMRSNDWRLDLTGPTAG
ncbi:GNAT family N-acetyltransferase [Micromonospora siamensis]|uniref:Protein N-acetyltransferase, RimJ/RimL family n=1 Tax=Micromonospora siamensis TaxID=299152 RepID=A0A1C5HI22_9ACTN|nr:GNAT family N-acetyltransferase [Micromonospora siamensis]SCG45635.1 Protein N-acetyltransferase, RimJ/RimL family [Micromonospora siamensis]